MNMNDYQELAARTINKNLMLKEIEMHALHGMVSEVGELHSIYQKVYQGHSFHEEHAKRELGDLMWFIAEFCSAHGWDMSDIAEMNINKLKTRYPEGFQAERSLNRADWDT